MASFILSPEARDDLREIRDYIARDSSEAAGRVLFELRTAIRRPRSQFLKLAERSSAQEGVTEEDFVEWQKAMLLDLVYLQQDAFDPVDAAMPRERQIESLKMLKSLIDADYDFEDKDHARDFFTRITGHYKNWNQSEAGSADAERFRGEIETLAAQHQVGAG